MNVMVTGASGFIGTHLVEAMSKDDAVDNIFALYRRKEQIPFIPKVNPVIGDLDSLPSIKVDARIDVAVHLAGYYKTESKKLCEEINVQGTKNTVSFCKNNSIPRIIFFSTINVNLKTKGRYAVSKAEAEEIVKNSGIDYMIVRPSLVYGGRVGSLGKIIGYAEKFPIFPIFGLGKAIEQPIHINELVELTLMMIKDFKPGEEIYAAGWDAIPFSMLVKTIGNCIGKKVRIMPIPAKPVYWIIKLAEKAGIHPGLSSEQVAHMSQDLAADMTQTLKLYPVKLKPFEEHIKADLKGDLPQQS
ncbi:MAG TPA: NAD-dependent epimerase/dehydratase family protein [Clostridia bacterium]